MIYKRILTKKDKEKNDCEVEIEPLDYDNKTTRDVLLLHNILTILNNEELNSEFPFDKYKKVSCDVEHISPTNIKKVPENKDEKIKLLKSRLEYFEEKDKEDIKNKISEINSQQNVDAEEYKDFYENKILNYFNEGLIKNDMQQNIGNLVLLNKEINRNHEYSNALFPEKRKILIEYDQKYRYIPLCTKNAFLKYYDEENMHNEPFKWTDSNAAAYRKDIVGKIEDFKCKIKNRVKNA